MNNKNRLAIVITSIIAVILVSGAELKESIMFAVATIALVELINIIKGE